MYRGSEYKPMERDNYSLRVRNYALTKNGESFFNEGKKHAFVVIDQLFNSAKQEVVMVTGCLSDDVFDIGMFENLFKKNVKVCVGYTDSNKTSTTLEKLQNLKKENSELLKIKKINEKFPHFCLVDNKHYRLERDKDAYTAICAFGGDVSKDDIDKSLFEIVTEAREIVLGFISSTQKQICS